MTELLQVLNIHLIVGLVAFGITVLGVFRQIIHTLKEKTTAGVSKCEVFLRLFASTAITIDLLITQHPLFLGSLIMTATMLAYTMTVVKYRKY